MAPVAILAQVQKPFAHYGVRHWLKQFPCSCSHGVSVALVTGSSQTCNRKMFGLESSGKRCFARTFMAPTDWLQLWRDMTTLTTKSLRDGGQVEVRPDLPCQEDPSHSTSDMPKTLIAKDVLEESVASMC